MTLSKAAVSVSAEKINAFELFHIFPAIGFYLKKMIIPFPLNFAISNINTTIYSIVFFSFCLLSIYWGINKKISFLLVSMILVISFAPALPIAFGHIAWVPFAERYLYLSVSLAAICMVAYGRSVVQRGLISSKKQWIVFFAIIFVFSIATVQREFVWKNSQSLWADTLKQNPDSSMVLFKYGQAFGGETEIWAYQRAIANSDNFKFRDVTFLGIARYESAVQNYDKAIENIDKALAIKKNFNNLCQAAEIVLSMKAEDERMGKEYTAQAIKYYQIAYTKRKTAFVLYKIGTLMNQTCQKAESMQILEKVRHNHPNSKYALYAGTLLKKMSSYKNTEN
ncbi:hypothetical protein [Desulfobacula sp.]|uniref:tetratricopeptide repeat protein n=1 Tax=Desulfobacula sp. TaxID=2593537 RepID=UPI0026196888|nr:hypothetical protein [Desulfobacula sp.]